jgi:hypothetical protein
LLKEMNELEVNRFQLHRCFWGDFDRREFRRRAAVMPVVTMDAECDEVREVMLSTVLWVILLVVNLYGHISSNRDSLCTIQLACVVVTF